MNADKLADVLAGFGEAIQDVVDQLRNGAADAPQAAGARVGREVDADAPNDDDIVEVKAGDLWRLVNRSRKMIRLAREGKIPSMESRAPLCRSIKTLKQQGLVKKPRNVRD
jgi:hypothetical protein